MFIYVHVRHLSRSHNAYTLTGQRYYSLQHPIRLNWYKSWHVTVSSLMYHLINLFMYPYQPKPSSTPLTPRNLYKKIKKNKKNSHDVITRTCHPLDDVEYGGQGSWDKFLMPSIVPFSLIIGFTTGLPHKIRDGKFCIQIGPDWPQMGQIWDFLRSVLV